MFNNLSLQSFASSARDKLHSAASYGARDDVRLHRWVLLKNSLTNALSRSTEPSPSPRLATAPAPTPTKPEPPLVPVSQTLDEEDTDTFLFPDGDVFAESFVDDDAVSNAGPRDEDLASEAQWLNSLLESLGDDSENDSLVTVVTVDPEEEDEESDLVSLLDLPSSEDLSTNSMSSSAPESILLPPSPPLSPFNTPCALRALLAAPRRMTYDPSDLSDDIDALALPDVIEDSSSDTDSESLNTPFTRSVSSLAESHGHHQVGSIQRQPYVRIVDRDDVDATVASMPYPPYRYPFSFETGVSPLPPESFEQEC